ncbi:MAG: helix-turn-helix transcriptional regulator [Anaerolineaceae bacterium]
MPHADSKAARFSQIEALLMTHPEGLTQSQLARRLNVHRSTIMRNLADMAAPIYEEHGRLYINREAYLVNVRLTIHEAFAIHLAGRLMATRMDRANPHAASAFRKLGLALNNLAPEISSFISSSAETFDNSSKRQDPHYLQVLEKLTIAWARRIKTRLWYRSLEGGQVKEYTFCPFFVEVGAVGQAVYAIGQIEPEGMRTFKIERVERIELTSEPYGVPDSFDPSRLLDQAWAIWYSDVPPVEVILRFSARVAGRVQETRWHPAEEVEVSSDGSLVWKAAIAEPREMMPWIRGWGADCEVLAPAEVRERLREEAERMVALYQNEK